MISPHGPKRGRDGNTAFTLLEMLLAMAILGVLVAVSVPRTGRSFGNLALREAASTLAVNIRYAQARAIRESVPVRVLFNPARGQYRLEYVPRRGDRQRFVPMSGLMERVFQLPQDITFHAVDLRAEDGVSHSEFLVFHPDGSGGMGRIRIAGPGGSYDVAVTGRLGQVILENTTSHLSMRGGP